MKNSFTKIYVEQIVQQNESLMEFFFSRQNVNTCYNPVNITNKLILHAQHPKTAKMLKIRDTSSLLLGIFCCGRVGDVFCCTAVEKAKAVDSEESKNEKKGSTVLRIGMKEFEGICRHLEKFETPVCRGLHCAL